MTQRQDFEALLLEEGLRPFALEYTSPIGRAFATVDAYDRATKIPVRPWVIGPICDHIYPTCPHVQRSGKLDITETGAERLRIGAYETVDDPNNPLYLHPDHDPGGDVCGWCFRVWRARTSRVPVRPDERTQQ